MTAGTEGTGAFSSRTAWGVFCLLAGAYLLTAAGTLNAVDAWPPLAEAAAIVETTSVRYAELDPSLGAPEIARAVEAGVHGPLGPASKYGFGLHALYVPLHALARAAAPLLGVAPLTAAKSLLGFVNPLAGAAAMAIVALWIARALRTPRVAGVALLAGFGTFAWPLTAIAYSDPVQMLSVACVLWAAGRAAQERRPLDLHVLGAACLWAALCKLANAPLVLACAATALEGVRLRRLLAYAGPWAVATAAAQALVNAARFGSPFDTGYPFAEQFSPAVGSGAVYLLLSLDRGWIWFVPLLPVGLAGLVLLARRRPALGVPLAAGAAAHFLLIAAFRDVHGGFCLGPRYLLPLLPHLAIGWAEVLARWTPARRALLPAAVACALWTAPMAIVPYFETELIRTHLHRSNLARHPIPVRAMRLLAEKSVLGPDRVPLAPFSRTGSPGEVVFDAPDSRGWQWWWLKPWFPGWLRWTGACACAAAAALGAWVLLGNPRSGSR